MRATLHSLRSVEVPRGAILALCALVLAFPAGLAAAHQLNYDGQGNWVHHHTTELRICNDIDQDSQLKTKANEARDDWRALNASPTPEHLQTGVNLPSSQCHPSGAPAANIELMDAYFGDTGWRASTWQQSVTAGHLSHTHVRFNLSNFGSLVNQYHKRTLACREIGRTMGLALAPGDEGANNDCLSFWGNIQTERSKFDYPSNFTYSNMPGPHSRDTVRSAYANHAPELELAGALHDAVQTNSHLTDASYALEIHATPAASASSVVGLDKVSVSLNGSVQSTFTPPCSGCPIEASFVLATDQLTDGPHSLKVAVADDLGYTVSKTLPLSVDFNGDVYHAREYTDDPAGAGELVSEQWASLESGDSRTEDVDSITTRSSVHCDSSHAPEMQCAEMRQLTDLGLNEDAYVVNTGTRHDDPAIGGDAEILTGVEHHDAQPVGVGALASILEPWQAPPPAHGGEFEVYEAVEEEIEIPDDDGDLDEIDDYDDPPVMADLIYRVWVDSATKMPLKREVSGPTGVLGSVFYTYGERLEVGSLPGDFFSVAATQNVVLEQEVTEFGADEVGPQVDVETGATFAPQYLGESVVVEDEEYCLADSALFTMEEEVDATPPDDIAEDPENALDPDVDAAITSVHAGYELLEPGESCEPGEGGSEDATTIAVISEYRPSPDPVGWRDTYRAEAEDIDTDPEADPDSGGVVSVMLSGVERTGYAITIDADADDPPDPPEPDPEPTLSVLIVGTVQVIITGDFAKDEIQEIASQLEPQ